MLDICILKTTLDKLLALLRSDAVEEVYNINRATHERT